jgi:hypothetical protein
MGFFQLYRKCAKPICRQFAVFTAANSGCSRCYLAASGARKQGFLRRTPASWLFLRCIISENSGLAARPRAPVAQASPTPLLSLRRHRLVLRARQGGGDCQFPADRTLEPGIPLLTGAPNHHQVTEMHAIVDVQRALVGHRNGFFPCQQGNATRSAYDPDPRGGSHESLSGDPNDGVWARPLRTTRSGLRCLSNPPPGRLRPPRQ